MHLASGELADLVRNVGLVLPSLHHRAGAGDAGEEKNGGGKALHGDDLLGCCNKRMVCLADDIFELCATRVQ